MTYAPPSLIVVRKYLAAKTGRAALNFGIRGSSRGSYGYHYGRDFIYGPNGKGDRDYSVRRPRDKRGLSDAASGIDARLPVAQLKRMTEYLVTEALAGRADLIEVIGPGPDGRAYDWRKPYWRRIGPRPEGDSHEWHVHVSYPRDTEYGDRLSLWFGLYGLPDVPEPEPDPEPIPEPPPPEPTADEVELDDARDALDEIYAVLERYRGGP